MGFGGSILLIVVGAIFTFALNDQTIGPLDLAVVGWILMLAGLAGLILTLWFWNSRRRTTVVAPAAPPPAAGQVYTDQPRTVRTTEYEERRLS